MQISSQNSTQSILAIARQTALNKRSKDEGGSETESRFQSAASSSGVTYGSGYSSFQSSLSKSTIDGATPSLTADAPTSKSRLNRDSLTQSDWNLIQKMTGLTHTTDHTGGWYDADGNTVFSGTAVEQASAMVFGIADLRMYGSEDRAGNMVAVTGDITTEQLHRYFEKYQNSAAKGNGPFSYETLHGLEKAIDAMTSV